MRRHTLYIFLFTVALASINVVFARQGQLHRQFLQDDTDLSEAPAPEPFFLNSTPPVSLDYQGTFGDYITIPSKPDSNFFYSVVPAVNHTPDSPLLLWINGGPGVGGQVSGLIGSTGPYNGLFLEESDTNLYANQYPWNQVATVIYLDQPLNVGYSFSDNPDDQPINSTGSAKDAYEFIVEFYKKHPNYASPNFYIFGLSYGGAYVPPMAQEINQRNKETDDTKIPLKGVILAAPLTTPKFQLTSSGAYLIEQGLINEEDLEEANKANGIIKNILTNSEESFKDGSDVAERGQLWQTAYAIGRFANQRKFIPTLQLNDIRIECPVGPSGISECDLESFIEDYVNSEEFRNFFGIRNNSANNLQYEVMSMEVNQLYWGDRLIDYADQVEKLLDDDIRVLYYSASKDYNVDPVGVERLVRAFDWDGKEEFNQAPTVNFTVRGQEAGEITSYGPLTYVEIYDAGHDVPGSQPENCYIMLEQFLSEQPIQSVE